MSKDDVAEVKARTSLLELVKRFTNVRRVGNRWMAPCPFHQETKPSFSINEEEGFYYCFGCQAAGDVIDFYCRVHGLEFREGLEQLALEAGVELSRGPQTTDPKAKEKRQFRRRALDVYELAAGFYRQTLFGPNGEEGREYLKGRGLTKETVTAYGLGYAPEGWQHLHDFLRSRKVDINDAVECGLLVKNDRGRVYDRFRGRLMFPIQDLSGKVIAFGGRILISSDREPKYINSSDSAIYKKGEHLFGLSVARRAISVSRTALLTEGYMDVLTLHQYGYENACGVLGTALTADQVRRLTGFCSEVECIFDGDRAGQQAALRSAEMLLSAGLKCRVLILPEKEDVDSLLQTQGTEAFEAVRQGAPDGLEFCMETIQRDRSPKEIVQWAIQFVNNLSDPELAAFYAPRIMNGLGLSEEALRPALASHSEKRGGKKNRLTKGEPAAISGQAMRERHLLRFALCFPQHVPLLCERGADRAFATSRGRALWEKVIDYGPEGATAYMDEGEKRFFTECRMAREYLAEREEALLEDVLESLKEMAEQAKRQEIQKRLRGQAAHGAYDPMDDLRALQQTLGTGRNDGQ